MEDLRLLKLRPAKTDESSTEAQVSILAAFMNLGKRSFLKKLLWQSGKSISLEIYNFNQRTSFYMGTDGDLEGYLSSQILSRYPKTIVERPQEDPLLPLANSAGAEIGVLRQVTSYCYPIKYEAGEQDLPALSALLGFFSKLSLEEGAGIQFVISVPEQGGYIRTVRNNMEVKNADGTFSASPYKKLLDQKIEAPLLQVQGRIIVAGQHASQRIAEMAGTFGAYTVPEGNGISYALKRGGQRQKVMKLMLERHSSFWQPSMILNLKEVAALWHLPGKTMENIKAIDWGRSLLSEAPEELPVAEALSEEARRDVNFFAQTEWHNREAIFGIKREDRTKHTYIIGKTGAGKSTLIANMAINDIRNGEGVAIIDPHGDLSEMILDFIPKRRLNDVIYLDPTLSDDRSFSINLFDNTGAAHTDVVASGIISVFYKLYHYSWGPRLEYILRNTILTLLYAGDATFADIPRLLNDRNFRKRTVEKISTIDPLLTDFWLQEFEQMNDKLRTEAIAPVLNKVGQFLSSQRIRHIVGSQKSTFSLEEIMDQGKILILNLSQGKLGEDTTALLGAMFITKIQLASMRRVSMPKDQRKDFYLYVDEFQNFATGSFIKILSEARKYRLNLILANQYIGQVDEEIQSAIFGNVGTLMTFVVGARDAELFAKEFGGVFTPEDLVALGKFQVLLKMTIDGLTSVPFFAQTLPLPSIINQNKDKILRVGLERYYQKI